MKKTMLQAVLAVIGLVAVITGFLGLKSGMADPFYEISLNKYTSGNIILDSNLRYFSGLWLGLGIVIFWIIPSIEKNKSVFIMISLMIFLGAIGRIISALNLGQPSVLFLVFTIMELLFPLLIIWQNKLSDNV